MKKIILFVSLIFSVMAVSAQTAPTSPTQLTTNIPYYEPSTHNRWFNSGGNGVTPFWWQAVDSVQMKRNIALQVVLTNARMDSLKALYGALSGNNNWLGHNTYQAYISMAANSPIVFYNSAGTFYTQLNTNTTTTQNNLISFPNKTGVIALTNDLGTAGLTYSLTNGYGLTGSSFNNTGNVTWKTDSTAVQTIANLFPKTDTRYYTKTIADGRYGTLTQQNTSVTNIANLQNRNINTGYGTLGGGNLTADRTIIADSASATGLVSKSRLATNLGGYMPKAIITNVKDYGAVGDSTTDNTTAIRNAIAAMGASGNRTLYFPKGIYLISDTLNIPKACTIVGEGGFTPYNNALARRLSPVSVIIQTSASKCAFSVNADGVNFKSIGITTNNASSTATGVIFYKGNSATMLYSSVTNFFFDVHIVNGLEWSITNSYIGEPLSTGLIIEDAILPDGGDATITGTYFSMENGTTGIIYKSGGGLKMTNNKFNSANHYKYGIVLTNTAGNTGDLLLTNNSFENFSNVGIKVVPDSLFANTQITDNEIQGTAGIYTDTAVYINSSHVDRGIIQGNTISNLSKGIVLSAGLNVVIGINQYSANTTNFVLTGQAPWEVPSRINLESEAAATELVLGQISTANPKQLLISSDPVANTFTIQSIQQGVGNNQPLLINPSGGLVCVGCSTDPFSGSTLGIGGNIGVNGNITLKNSTDAAQIKITRALVTNYARVSYQTAGVDKWTTGLRGDASTDYTIYDEVNSIIRFRINQTTGAASFAGSLTAINYYSTSTVPAIVAGTGAGTSPTISISGNNQDGIITLTTGTTPAASGTIATITMSGSFAYPNLTVATLQARNQGSSILTGSSAVTTGGTTTTFTIIAGTTALQAGVNYIWAYHNGGN